MKLSKQLASFEALQRGKIQMIYTESGVIVIGPRGKPLIFNFASGYAKVSVPDKSKPNRQISVPVHILVMLDVRLKQNPGKSLLDSTYPEGWEVDHIDGQKTNNAPQNLRVGSKQINQRNKPKLESELNGDQIKALQIMQRCFPNLDQRALATSIGRTTRQIQKALEDRSKNV